MRVLLLTLLILVSMQLACGLEFLEVSSTIRRSIPSDLGPLQEYVNRPDSNYRWERLPQFDAVGSGYKVVYFNMTSQRWLTDADVSRSLWYHYQALIIPDNLNTSFADAGLMYIGGGGNGQKPPDIWDKEMIMGGVIAKELGVVVTMLYNVPNEPVYFFEETPKPKHRTEDALIAWTWKHYLEDPSNPEWLARMPMTKAGMRGMDAATEVWNELSGNTFKRWLVCGASKRGWTTWTVGAMDPRVVAIVPMVLDELNFVKNIHHHYRAYGGWSFALNDYWELNFTAQLDNPRTQQMMDIVDPISYKSVLTMPKLILSTAGDEFLLPDNVDYFFDDLEGEKHFRLFPNLEHTMVENLPEVVSTLTGFAASILTHTPRPQYKWSKTQDGTIVLDINPANPPSFVRLWTAYTIDNSTRRDFRLVAIDAEKGKPWLHPVFWKGADLKPTSTNATNIQYQAYVEPPQVGWVGFVVEFGFPGAMPKQTIKFSTAPSILPQTFPYPDCCAEACHGPLV